MDDSEPIREEKNNEAQQCNKIAQLLYVPLAAYKYKCNYKYNRNTHHITSHYNASALTLEDFVEVSFFDIFLQPGGQAGVH